MLSQIGGQGVLPAGALLELGETAGVGGEAEAQVVEQEDGSEGEGFQRVERIVRTGDQVRHLPEGVQMGDVVDGEVGEVAVDLTGEHLGPFPHLEQGVEQALARLGVRVRSGLRGQGPAEQGVVEEIHDLLKLIASRTGAASLWRCAYFMVAAASVWPCGVVRPLVPFTAMAKV